jgi:hypothetical protein
VNTKPNNVSFDVGVTVVYDDDKDSSNCDSSDTDDSSSEDLSQIEVKCDELQTHLSRIISQTIVFSFHQKKHFKFLNLVPSIAVCKRSIQFHFYDAENDLYFVNDEMPLFDVDGDLLLTTVIATWLVLNYRIFVPKATEGMLKEGKFGFHSYAQDSLILYQNDITMGNINFKPRIFRLGSKRAEVLYSGDGEPVEVMFEMIKKRKVHAN